MEFPKDVMGGFKYFKDTLYCKNRILYKSIKALAICGNTKIQNVDIEVIIEAIKECD